MYKFIGYKGKILKEDYLYYFSSNCNVKSKYCRIAVLF